jgi:hypothetical protein
MKCEGVEDLTPSVTYEILTTAIVMAVGIATGYGLEDQKVGVRVTMGAKIFTSPCPDRL